MLFFLCNVDVIIRRFDDSACGNFADGRLVMGVLCSLLMQ